MMDITAMAAIEVSEKEFRIAQTQLKVIKLLSKVKPSLRRAVLELAMDSLENQ